MRLSFAPMEGITGHVLRSIHAQCFPGTDRYYTPFLTANQNRNFKHREITDILQKNNQDVCLIPQILADKPDDFVWAVHFLEEAGYREVNLNLGCPSPTVLRQHRGAAMLQDPEHLDRFFDETFSFLGNEDVRITVKIRSGFSKPDEIIKLAEVLNKYSFPEVILHPRTAEELYRGKADREVYRIAAELIKHPLTYNGDIYSRQDIEDVRSKVPGTDSFMIGRGLLVNPALCRELKGGPALRKEELQEYHDRLFDGYREEYHQDRTVLFRMKELWSYMGRKIVSEQRDERLKRNIMKADSISEYTAAVTELFRKGNLTDNPQVGFDGSEVSSEAQMKNRRFTEVN